MARRILEDVETVPGTKYIDRQVWTVANVAARIFEEVPKVETYFRAYLRRKCPLFSLDSREGAAAQCDTNNFDMFSKRVNSYFRLWLAILVLRKDLSPVWAWLAGAVNGTMSPIIASMLLTCLEVASNAAQRRYQMQFTKLLHCINDTCVPVFEADLLKRVGDEKDLLKVSIARLQIWLEEYLPWVQAKRELPPPEGQQLRASFQNTESCANLQHELAFVDLSLTDAIPETLAYYDPEDLSDL